MLKKLISIITVTVMLLSCIGAVSVSADDIVSEVITFEDTGVDVGETASDIPDSAWDRGGYYWIDADMDAYYVAKFDLSRYVFPVKNVELKIHYRESGVGTTYVFAVPNNWSAGTSEDSLTYNKLVALTEGKLTKEDADFSINWNGGLNEGTSYYSSALDITALVNERLSAPGAEKVLSLAIARTTDDGDSAVHRMSRGKSKIIITQDEPVYNYYTEGTTTKIKYADAGKIQPDDTATADIDEGAVVTELATINSYTGYKVCPLSAKLPYGQQEAIYIKFNLSDINGAIESAQLNFSSVCRGRTWYMVAYLVENDNWTHETLTWNTAYDVDKLTESATLVFDADNTISASNLPAPGLYAPNHTKYITFTDSNNSLNSYESNSIDVTSLVQGQTDGYVTIALTAWKNGAHADDRHFAVRFTSTSYPTLEVKTVPVEGAVTTSVPSFKVNDSVSETLSDGIISAEVEATSTMTDATRTTMIMAVYEGNRLSKIYVSPQQKINDKNTNGGKTTVSVTSGEEIDVTSETRISVFMWKDISLPLPLGSVKTIRVQ